MLLSVLIPTYNSQNTIKKCVMSALNQTYADDYEVLVLNNASTDDTLNVLESIEDKKLRIITNPQTVSMFANHNLCMKYAKSDYVVFLHSDDELFPDALRILAKRLEERMFPPRYICSGHSMFRDVYENMQLNMHCGPIPGYNVMFSGETALRIFLSGALFQPTGTCFSRKTILEIGGFLALELSCPEDWYICAWAAFNYFEFEVIDRLLLKRELSSSWGDSISQSEKSRRFHLVKESFLRKLDERQEMVLRTLYYRWRYVIWDEFFKPSHKSLVKLVINRPWRIWRWKKLINQW